MGENHQAVVQSVRHWVERMVVGYNLCPFAKRELVRNRVRFIVSEADTEEALLLDLQQELQWLISEPDVETTLLIHPFVLGDFYDFNNFLDIADSALVQLELEGIIQIASFHPNYQFGGTHPDDAENYTNRSPYPILHLLREASLETAIERYPDTEEIPARNIALMEELGVEKLKALLNE